MKKQQIYFLMMVLLVGLSFTSCSNNQTAEDEQLYEQGIDKKEIKDQDT